MSGTVAEGVCLKRGQRRPPASRGAVPAPRASLSLSREASPRRKPWGEQRAPQERCRGLGGASGRRTGRLPRGRRRGHALRGLNKRCGLVQRAFCPRPSLLSLTVVGPPRPLESLKQRKGCTATLKYRRAV